MTDAMTVRRALAQAGLAPIDAQTLLAHVLSRDRAWLVAHASDPLPADQVHAFLALARRYEAALGWAVRHRWVVVGGSAATVLLAVGLFLKLKREFVPPEDRGYFVTFVMGPEGAVNVLYRRELAAASAEW